MNIGDIYYTPKIAHPPYQKRVWEGGPYDHFLLRLGAVFSTVEEAKACYYEHFK